jgi:hypothetical protein
MILDWWLVNIILKIISIQIWTLSGWISGPFDIKILVISKPATRIAEYK